MIDGTDVCGKKGHFKWATSPLKNINHKFPFKNIVHIRPRTKNNAQIAESPLDCFDLFFDDAMLDAILLHSNNEIAAQRNKYADPNKSSLKNMEKLELKALIGLLLLAGTLKNNHLPAKILFDTSVCGYRYRGTMPLFRFNFLINCLRFDDRNTRDQRREESKLAPIKEIWDKFISNCKSNYEPGIYLTIDEQLVGFRGKCPFRMYLPSKPNKYGLKIIMICDESTKYMVNAIPYLGKGTTPKNIPSAEYFVEELVKDFRGSKRNITTDNWFTSIPLSIKLLNEYQLTTVGTIKKNKPEFPPQFTDLSFKERKLGSSIFLFHSDITAVSYMAKKNKLVTLVSTMHDDNAVEEKSGKPEIILCYNSTKGAVDTLDQMVQNMNVGRKTKRWPMAYFYNMLNIGSCNAYVIYLHNFYKNNHKNKPYSRFDFMMNLVDSLISR